MRDFAEIAHLDTAGLRALLDAGAAPERVRAAWALALRLGEGLRSELSEAARTEPNPGVRRHLVFMLAGYQERSVLAALATGDPDVVMRSMAGSGARPSVRHVTTRVCVKDSGRGEPTTSPVLEPEHEFEETGTHSFFRS